MWDEMQRTVGEHMNPEFFVKGLEGLNDLLFWTSHCGEHLSKRVDQTPKWAWSSGTVAGRRAAT